MSVRDVDLDPKELKGIASDTEQAASRVLLTVARDVHAQLTKLAKANGGTVESMARIILGAA